MADRILIVSSSASEHAPYTDITWATQRKYAERHGYDFVADVSNVAAKDEPTHFGQQSLGYLPLRGFIKLDLLLHYLDPVSCQREYDWVVWLDSDLLVTNYDIPISQWTEIRENNDDGTLVLPYDANGHNATVIIANNNDLVYDFLWACNSIGRKYYLRDSWAEMNAMRFFAQTEPYNYLVLYRSIKELCGMPPNAYGIPRRVAAKYEWSKGDFAVHFSAMSTEDRAKFARKYADELGLL
jgi:hypothetical protein